MFLMRKNTWVVSRSSVKCTKPRRDICNDTKYRLMASLSAKKAVHRTHAHFPTTNVAMTSADAKTEKQMSIHSSAGDLRLTRQCPDIVSAQLRYFTLQTCRQLFEVSHNWTASASEDSPLITRCTPSDHPQPSMYEGVELSVDVNVIHTTRGCFAARVMLTPRHPALPYIRLTRNAK